jgi:hypothetical protein
MTIGRPSSTALSVMVGGLATFALACQVTLTPGYIADDKKSAEQAIATLHEAYNASESDAIWSSAHPAFQAGQTKEATHAGMQQSLQQFGKFERLLDCRINVLIRVPVEVRAACNSQFEKAVGTEMFIYVKVGSQLQLARYSLAPGPATLPPEKSDAKR